MYKKGRERKNERNELLLHKRTIERPRAIVHKTLAQDKLRYLRNCKKKSWMRKEIDGGRGLHLQDFIRSSIKNSVNPLNSVSSLLGLFVSVEVILREFENVRYF